MDSSSSSSSKKILSNHPSVRSSSSNTNPNPRIAILRWMSTLTPHQRQSHLTIVDANFIRILFQMYRRIQLTGHGFFLILPDIPSTSTPGLPSLIFRRSSGLLSRSSKRNQCEISIANALRLFGSKEGVGVERCEVDSLTVSEDFVADLDWFVKVMDVVSNGAFLRGDVDGSVVGGEWGEMKWLKDKGYYNLECFVANRIEIALRLAWMLGPGGGKKQKWPRLFREKSGDIAIAANLFWKRRGCVDWFMEMDPEIRKRVCLSFYGKRANYLVKEVLMTSDDLLKDGMFLLKSKPNPSQKSVERFASSQWGDQLLGNMDLEFSLHAIPEPISGTNSNKSNFMRSLIVMQQLLDMLLVCQNNEPDAEHIFFTSLSSSQTISDFIVRRLRGFLMLIFSEYIEFELTRDTTLSIPAKNTEEKSFAGSQRNKKKSRKRRGSTKKLADNNLTAKEPPKVQLKQQEHPIDPALLDLVCEISPAVPTNHNVTSLSQKEESIVRTNRKDHTTELINNKAHTPRKRKGVKSKNVVSEKINNKIISSQLGSFDISLPLHVSQSKVSESADTYNTLSCTLTNTEGQVNSPLKLGSSITDNGPDTKSDKEADKNLNIDNSSQSYIHSHSNDRHCQISDHTEIVSTSNLQCMNTRKNGNLIKERDSTVPRKCTYSANNKISTLACECETCIDTQTTYKGVSGFLTDNDVRHTSLNLSGHTMKNDHAMSQMENDSCNPHSQANVVSSIHFNSEADIMHLDAGHSQFNHLHQSLLSTTHQVRNVLTERACAVAIPSQTPPVSVDWPPVVRTCSRLSQLAAPNYESIINNTRLQPTICSGVPNNGMQFQPAVAHGNNERRHSEDVVDFPAFHNSSDMIDDTENYWVSDEEPDMHTLSGSDYNKYFGGGIMYWNTSDYVGTGFSRPPSHSSEDSSWAWYDADINRAIDDMVGLPGLPSYGVNGMASPLETLGPAQQSRGYLFSGTDINGMDSQVQGTDLPEELISRSLNTSNNSEGIKTDSLSYPILRPIIIPSALRKSSRSEFRINHDHRSPCFSSSRSDRPRRIKRPPSPMVLCVPHAPQVPPPSIGDSRKIRGFPVVRSGSSSPRHWGVRNWYHEEITSDHVHCCMDGPEVVWRPWQNKSLSRDEMMQNIPGSLMQDRLIVMSQQLGRDQEHPDVSFPVQPPESMNSSSWKASLTMMQNTLHEEINFFCRQVATESHSKKPFINWAVKRVARSLQVLWPRSQTNIYGSNATGLDLPTSDVDLVVCLPPVRNLEPIKEAGILEGRNGIKETCLQHAARYLANQEWVKSDSLKTIENTAIPLIMLVAEVPIDIIAPRGNISNSQSLEGLEASSSMMSVQSCNIISPAPVDLENNSPNLKDSYAYVKHVRLDISFKSPSHTGLQTTHLVRELTEQFPASIPLALILKQFLADRSLDHSNSGGLSSYCLVLLIIRFLQHEHHLGQLVNQNLGSLLMDFLYFFGNVFDPRQMRVSIQRSGFYINRERGQSIDPIHIDDPLCSMTNVGRNCFRIHQCIKAFADAYSVLETQITHFPCKSDNPIPIKLLPKIIPTIEHQGET